MSRLQCVGTSSKVPSKDTEAVKPGILTPKDAPVNKSVQPKKQFQKPKPSTRPVGQQTSAITERRPEKGNVDRITVDTELVSEPQSAQQDNSFKRTNVKHSPAWSETNTGLQALSPGDMITHGQERSPRHSVAVGSGEKTVSPEFVQKMNEPVVQVPQCLGVPQCGTGRSTSDEEESEEADEDMAEFHAPLELLAEFLKAVMENKYTLAKKLCKMILIYEPENPEAKHFLPLIEKRLLIEEAQKDSSSEDNTSDDDDDDDDDESSSGSDDDDDDDDTDTVTDSGGENSDSCSSSSDRKDEDVSQR